MLRIIIAMVFALFISACSPVMVVSECESANWYDIGRQDGNAGRIATRFYDYSHVCSSANPPPDERSYVEGYLEGRTYFCTYETGFDHGKVNRFPHRICPENSLYTFGYLEGRQEFLRTNQVVVIKSY